MYENENYGNEAKLTPPTDCVKENGATICATAANLLGCLRHIEEMMDQLDKTLFNADSLREKPCEPDCLDSNIAFAFESAKDIARHLDKILGRL